MKKLVLFLLIVGLCLPLLGCRDEEKTETMVAYLDESLDQVERRSLATQINQIEGVISTRYITAQEALEKFLAQQGDDPAFDGIDAGDLRDRIEIRVSSRDAEKIHKQLAQIQGIAHIRRDKLA